MSKITIPHIFESFEDHATKNKFVLRYVTNFRPILDRITDSWSGEPRVRSFVGVTIEMVGVTTLNSNIAQLVVVLINKLVGVPEFNESDGTTKLFSHFKISYSHD